MIMAHTMPQICKNKHRAEATSTRRKTAIKTKLALTRFEAGVGLVDDVNTTLATDQLVVAMALHQALEGVTNFH
jgi:formiminotetrahydrofolate cyclodeaminase